MKHRPHITYGVRLRPLWWAGLSLQLAVAGTAAVAADGAAEAKPDAAVVVSKGAEATNSVVKPSASTTTNLPARLDQASFRLISDRNIFNPTRSSRAASNKAESEPRKVIKVESVSLVGTMSYEKGDFAFFDGSGADFKKVVKADETIAGFKVQQISFSQVSLVQEGKTLTLPVGGKLRRQDGGPWEVTASAEKGSAEVSASSSEASSADESSSGDSGESDVLKRLLKKREQEMKNEK